MNPGLVESCPSVSNLTVVCRDGVLSTHKIVAATASDYLKSLLCELPAADEVTLYLPDFSENKVRVLLASDTGNSDFFTDRIEDNFDPTSSNEENIDDESSENTVAVNNESEDTEEENDTAKCGKAMTDFVAGKVKSLSQAATLHGVNKRTLRNFFENSAKKKEIDKMRELITKREEEKRRKFERAIAAITTGQVPSGNQAARMFGVNAATLGKLLKSGKSYVGLYRRRTTVLSLEEEQAICDRILVEGGKDLTYATIQNILKEEMEKIKIKEPHRTEVIRKCPDSGVDSKFYNFAFNFGRRNGLHGLCSSKGQRVSLKNSKFECDICGNRFTSKSSLTTHIEVVHSKYKIYFDIDEGIKYQKPK